MKAGWIFIWWVIGLGALAAVIWAIVVAAENDHRGIYAGVHFGDGANMARDAMIATHGRVFTSHLRWGHPPVYNTHLSSVVTGSGQVRIYHMVGPRGTKWCVSIWNPHPNWTRHNAAGNPVGIDIGSSYLIEKGCKF